MFSDAAGHADVFSERPADAARSDLAIHPGRARAPAPDFALRSRRDRARMGARLPLRFCAARARCDALRRTGIMAERLCPMPSQTVGPFYHFGLTENAALGCLTRPEAKGEHIALRVRLWDGDGAPVPDGMIELWQADASGKYDHPADAQERAPDAAFRGFGRLATDPDGFCTRSEERRVGKESRSQLHTI